MPHASKPHNFPVMLLLLLLLATAINAEPTTTPMRKEEGGKEITQAGVEVEEVECGVWERREKEETGMSVGFGLQQLCRLYCMQLKKETIFIGVLFRNNLCQKIGQLKMHYENRLCSP